MPQREQWSRILEIDRRIRTGLYPHPESLAQEFGVSRRVLFNDRQFLLYQLRAPLDFHRQRRGWYYTDKTFVLPTAVVTQGELLAFFLSVEVAKRYLGTVLETPLLSAIAKIAQSLPDKVQVDLERLRSHYTFATPAMAVADEKTLLDLDEAIARRLVVHILYYTASRGERNERDVHPHHLHHIEGDWHLIAFDRKRGRLTTFNVGRIEECKVLEQHFIREPDFEAGQWLHSMFHSERAAEVVPVAIRFMSIRPAGYGSVTGMRHKSLRNWRMAA